MEESKKRKLMRLAEDSLGHCYGECLDCPIRNPCSEYKRKIFPTGDNTAFALFKQHQAKLELWKWMKEQ